MTLVSLSVRSACGVVDRASGRCETGGRPVILFDAIGTRWKMLHKIANHEQSVDCHDIVRTGVELGGYLEDSDWGARWRCLGSSGKSGSGIRDASDLSE